ncbi:hypothetical protein, partial [Klebsiella pneumoniae]|uniref:hypothetical protein n=1 Tax=Klebsiella pneumoniae TaxID=573 RepID=UPI001C8CA617
MTGSPKRIDPALDVNVTQGCAPPKSGAQQRRLREAPPPATARSQTGSDTRGAVSFKQQTRPP